MVRFTRSVGCEVRGFRFGAWCSGFKVSGLKGRWSRGLGITSQGRSVTLEGDEREAGSAGGAKRPLLERATCKGPGAGGVTRKCRRRPCAFTVTPVLNNPASHPAPNRQYTLVCDSSRTVEANAAGVTRGHRPQSLRYPTRLE